MSEKKGFTLLELLIVIAIIAVLSVILIIVLDPAETLKKSRDAQRISDLATMKTALGIYVTSINMPQLDGASGTRNDKCISGGTAANAKIWLSVSTTITDITPPTSAWTTAAGNAWVPAGATPNTPDGNGWIPVNLGAITGGSPVSSMPQDPINDVVASSSLASSVTNDAIMYRYACSRFPLGYEINATLESATYGPGGTDDKSTKDGGNNTRLYEAGTRLTILPDTNDF